MGHPDQIEARPLLSEDPYSHFAGVEPNADFADKYTDDPPDYTDVALKDSERFPQQPKFRDPVFALLFFLNLVASVGVFIVARLRWEGKLGNTTPTPSSPPNTATTTTTTTTTTTITTTNTLTGHQEHHDLPTNIQIIWHHDSIILIVCVVALSAVLSGIALMMYRFCAKILIYVSSLLVTVGMLVLGIVSIALWKVYWSGAILIIFAVLMALILFFCRSRIDFAAATLQYSASNIMKHKGVLVVAFINMLLMAGFICFYIIGIVWASEDHVFGLRIFFWIYLAFSMFWTLQLLSAISHTTTSGTLATEYFFGGTNAMPEHATLGALGRACSWSLGSLCMGSLIVAVLRTLKLIARSMANRSGGGHWASAILAGFCWCILQGLERLMRYFNKYAFAYVAIYGLTFVQSAKAVWRLFKKAGFEGILNDDFIQIATFFTCLCVGGITAGAACMGVHLSSDLSEHENTMLFYGLAGLGIGFCVCLVVSEVVESGVTTIFVCFVENPGVLQQLRPDIYESFFTAYTKRKANVNMPARR